MCCAAANLLLFDLYLRPTEGLELEKQRVLPPRRGPRKLWTIVVCPSTEAAVTETRQQDDTLQLGDLCPDRRWLSSVLKALYDACRPGGRLFSLTLAEYEGHTRAVLKASGPSALKITPH